MIAPRLVMLGVECESTHIVANELRKRFGDFRFVLDPLAAHLADEVSGADPSNVGFGNSKNSRLAGHLWVCRADSCSSRSGK